MPEFTSNEILLGLGLLVYAIFAVGILTASVILWILAGLRWSQRERVLLPFESAEPEPIPVKALLTPALIALVWVLLMLVTMYTSEPPWKGDDSDIEKIRGLLVSSVFEKILVLSFLGMVTAISIVLAEAQPAQAGFPPQGLFRQLLTGGLGFLAAMVPVMLVLFLSMPLRSEETLHPFLRFMSSSPTLLEAGLIAVTAVILAPLEEELIFRVLLQRLLAKYLPWQLAIVIVAGLFAAVHGFPDSLAILPLAVVLGYFYQRTRSYLTVVTIHALFNAFNLTTMMLYQVAEQLQPQVQ